MRAVLISTLALAASAFGASAEETFTADPALADNDRVIYSINVEDLKALAIAEGHTITDVGVYGDDSVQATTPDGLIFHLIGTACETEYSEDCLGFQVQVRYDDDETVTTDLINQANLSYAAVSTWWDADEAVVGVTRYVILDGGQRMENLKVNIQNAVALGPLVADVIWPVDEDEYDDYDYDYDDDE